MKKRLVPQGSMSTPETKAQYIGKRLEIYGSLNSEYNTTWSGFWPTYHFWQGSNGDFQLSLPQLFCVLRHVDELRNDLKKILKSKDNIDEQNGLPETTTHDETELEWDVPFKHKN